MVPEERSGEVTIEVVIEREDDLSSLVMRMRGMKG
jgi:hypothetical protein